MIVDQLATVTIALVILLAVMLMKLRDRKVRAGAVGYRAEGRVATVPDPRRGSPLFDQDAV